MNGMDRNRIDNYNSIISLLLENKDIVSSVRAFSYSTSKLCKIVEIIKKQERALRSEQFRKTFRNSKSKDNLISFLIPIAAALYSYGKKTGDEQLCMKYCRITQNYLMSLSENELLNKSISVKISAEKNLKDLKEYNISHNDIQTLKFKIEHFKYAICCNNESDYFFSPADTAMDGLFLEADKLLNSMDSYVENLNMSHSGFYNKYLLARNNDHFSGKRPYHRYTA